MMKFKLLSSLAQNEHYCQAVCKQPSSRSSNLGRVSANLKLKTPIQCSQNDSPTYDRRGININHVRVSRPFIRMTLENTMASLVILELDRCDAEPQDFAEMTPVAIRDLRISRCHSNGGLLLSKTWRYLDGECMNIDITLRRLTEAYIGKMKRLCPVDTCQDTGCRDLLHLTRVMEISTGCCSVVQS
ncbi:hypothetical protein EV421DRAFT_169817 [Armillaria borealis]|uniref:Uncharacterized protein n=1 Tax=Armillaria borealis TaxID=47425 RepID=A0AA39IX81_9AGAR|nr:hypothetical protein EV421DRAFT_169817 [Armillaria borealis]